ncbi:hypothetical protein GCM10009634_52830 [Saccharothrix xinjiangensis]
MPTAEPSRCDGRRSTEDARFRRSFRRTCGGPGTAPATTPVTIPPKKEDPVITTSTTVEMPAATTPPAIFRLPPTTAKALVRVAEQAELEQPGARVGLPSGLGVLVHVGGTAVLVILRRRLRRQMRKVITDPPVEWLTFPV